MKKITYILCLFILCFTSSIACFHQPQRIPNQEVERQTERQMRQYEAEKREEIKQAQPRPTVFVNVYYLDKQGDLIALKRTVPQLRNTEQQVENALNKLTESPLEKDISTAIPAGTKILGVEVRDRVAYTNFNRKLEQIGGIAQVQTALDQIVYTATEIEGVDKVRLLIEGKAIDTFTGEGVMVDQPLGRRK